MAATVREQGHRGRLLTRQVVLVLGSPGSGAGMAAGILEVLGYRIPKPVITNEGSTTDGESEWLVDFHSSLLSKSGVLLADARPEAWGATTAACFDQSSIAAAGKWLTDQLGTSDFVVLRDSRLAWFTSLWDQAARESEALPSYILVVRLPEGVGRGRGLWSANQSTPTDRVVSWINTTLYSERATRGKARAIVSTQQLASDWTAAIAAVDDAIGLPPVSDAPASEMVSAGKLVDPVLAAPHPGWQELEVAPAVSDLADRTWRALQGSMVGGNGDGRAELDALRAEYRALYRTAEEIARSSIVAAGKPPPADDVIGEKSPDATEESSRALKAAGLIPARLRHAVPVRLRKAIVRMLP